MRRGYKPTLGLTGNDFDAHRGAAARGRPRSRESQRARLRERMSAWGRRATPRISALGIDVDLELTPEDDTADVLIFRTPGEAGRFVLRVDSEGVEVGLELSRVTLTSELAEQHMLASLESLPEQFVIRSAGHETVAQSTDLEVLRAARSFIGWRVPRTVAIEHAEDRIADRQYVLDRIGRREQLLERGEPLLQRDLLILIAVGTQLFADLIYTYLNPRIRFA